MQAAAPQQAQPVDPEACSQPTADTAPLALVVGDPQFGDGWAAELAGARAEARSVKSLLSDSDEYENRVKTLVGSEATKASVVAAIGGCEVIHLATHGEPDGVLLGGPTRAAGCLSMAEVHALQLRASLVTLSECDSFRGELRTDGVVGIARAFVAAGALTLIASLWKVDDEATLQLMRRFYAAWLRGDTARDAPAAMRQAMVGMIADGKWAVAQWAAFVVYGQA